MRQMTFCGETIKVNEREEKLTIIIKQDAERVLEYYHENKFGCDVYERILDEIRGYISALFFMDVLKEPHSAYELEVVKADEEFLEYMFGDDWYKIYE